MKGLRILIFGLLIIFVFSCKTKEFITGGIFDSSLSENELVENAFEKRNSINRVLYKRVSIHYNGNKENQSFRSNIFLEKDSSLIVSVLAPFGIEVARIKFAPEEVTIIDRLNRSVIYTDYEIVKKKFNVALDFDVLQSLFLNRPFSYYSQDGQFLKDYYLKNDDNLFCLSSLNQRKYERLLKRGGNNYILHSIWLDPEFYLLQKTSFRKDVSLNLDVNFRNFSKDYSDFLFPDGFNISGNYDAKDFAVDIKYGNVTFNGDNSISFNIPEKYESIYR